MYIDSLDIPIGNLQQVWCMKLGSAELYQPIQSSTYNVACWVHTCNMYVACLGISNEFVAVPRQDSICPCRASYLGTATYICEEAILPKILRQCHVHAHSTNCYKAGLCKYIGPNELLVPWFLTATLTSMYHNWVGRERGHTCIYLRVVMCPFIIW